MNRPEAYKDFDLTDRPGEVWKDVVGVFGEAYEVSNQGRVRSKERLLEHQKADGTMYRMRVLLKIRKSQISHKGYVVVRLLYGDDRLTTSVHSLVAAAFIGPRPADKPQINHIDTVKTNNYVENLEYCDQSHNQLHAFANGLIDRKGVKNGKSKLTAEQVKNLRADFFGKKKKWGDNHAEKLAEKYGIEKSGVYKIVQGQYYNNIE